ncbi:MAG: hypothetical protein JWQ00_1755 [Noviherbaspirillum sp.]|nr:hypothetical protein [Noviherbaspirillum sp.]
MDNSGTRFPVFGTTSSSHAKSSVGTSQYSSNSESVFSQDHSVSLLDISSSSSSSQISLNSMDSCHIDIDKIRSKFKITNGNIFKETQNTKDSYSSINNPVDRELELPNSSHRTDNTLVTPGFEITLIPLVGGDSPRVYKGKAASLPDLEELYKKFEVPLNEKTYPYKFPSGTNLIEEKTLGSGANNEVKKLTYKLPNGETKSFAFKPAQIGFGAQVGKSVSNGLLATGIVRRSEDKNGKLLGTYLKGGEQIFINEDQIEALSDKDMQTFNFLYEVAEASLKYGEGCRNIATYVVAQMLGCERVVTKAQFFIHEGKLGILMELAGGKPVNRGSTWNSDITGTAVGEQLLAFHQNSGNKEDFEEILAAQCDILGIQGASFVKSDSGKWTVQVAYSTKQNISKEKLMGDPSIKKQASEAEIVDFISGQADRHSNNYFIDMDENGKNSTLKLIDNDISFGPRSRADVIRSMKDDGLGSILGGFPERISKEVHAKLKKLTEKDFDKKLGGLISEDEISIAIESCEELKKHFELHPEKVISSDEEWRSAPLSGYLKRDTTVRPNSF